MEHNKLNARDLMLGDWIRAKGEVGQVNLIDETADTPLIGIAPRDLVMIDKCEPIPLTPEILEKNGWEVSRRKIDRSGRYVLIRPLKEKEWGLVATDDRTIIDFSIGCEEISDVGLKVSLFFCELTVKFGGRIDRVSYVHELQHALRLCGIDKEITL